MTDQTRRRACILDAADRLLRHYGPQKTTVADVAREAGVGVGTVYLEFPSKDVLVEELSRARYRDVLQAMRTAAARSSAASERLTAAFDARVGALLDIAKAGAHACDLVHCSSEAVKAAEASFQVEELELVTELVAEGIVEGELAGDEDTDMSAAARTVLRAYVSFSLPWLRGRDEAEVRAALASMHALVLDGLRSRVA